VVRPETSVTAVARLRWSNVLWVAWSSPSATTVGLPFSSGVVYVYSGLSPPRPTSD
jgi:hypothetical protein